MPVRLLLAAVASAVFSSTTASAGTIMLPAMAAPASTATAPAQPAVAATELFTAQTTGTIVVAPDGTVESVELKGESTLGRSEIAGYENHLRGWRFEPVRVDGVAVRAKAHMQLSLVAARAKGSTEASFGIRQVWFAAFPKDRGFNPALRADTTIKPPQYPSDALRRGFGGEVYLLLELAADGSVVRANAEQVSLLGPSAGALAMTTAESMVRVAEQVAQQWRIGGMKPGSLVRVPVSFSAARDRMGWVQMHPIRWKVAPWIADLRAGDAEIAALASSGAPSSLTLLSRLPSVPGLDEEG